MLENLHNSKFVKYIGHVAVFYIPVQKLESLDYTVEGMTPKKLFEKYLLDHFNAFSFRVTDTKGFWRRHEKSKIFIDINARYEVSFIGEEAVLKFVDYLSCMCALLEEEAIYLVMGHKSWLVDPAEGDKDVIRRKIQEYQRL